MKFKNLLKKLFIIFLAVSSGILITESRASCQTAAARFKVAPNEVDSVGGGGDGGGGGCYINALKGGYSETQIRYLVFDDVSAVRVIITGQGINIPIELLLTKSSSGYYEGTQSNLPAGVELNFKTEARDAGGKIIAQAENSAVLEANKITDISLTLSPIPPKINIPIVVLKTTDAQINPDKTAKIEIIISDDSGQVLCDISHSSGKGSLSNTGGLVTLINGTRTIETILTPDISGGYTDIITVKVDDRNGGIAINKMAITIEYNTDIKPAIEFTYVPPIGSGDYLRGIVQGVNPDGYSIAVYIKVFGGWWTKPYFAWPLTSIKSDLTWECDIVTGGSDSQASYIAAFLIPNTFNPPALGGSSSLPQILYDNSAAYVSVAR